ncbi:MAG: HNH endonuclease [Chromatiales bacterium]|nr:HNH endonuclease [Chromatiales bacterium]
MSAESSLRFLRQLQRLLDEGLFTSTYKYALLQALADLSVEQEPGADGGLWLAVPEIAEKFVEYYWRQALPFSPPAGAASAVTPDRSPLKPLLQNTDGQAAVITHIVAARSRAPGGSLAALRQDTSAWLALRNKVASVIRGMPLWKLQTVPGEATEFLYRKAEFRDDRIRLLPGVPAAFRNFHGLVTNLVRGAWVARVQRIPGNREVLGETASLEGFLFGTDRATLAPWREILRDHQSGRCFYCRSRVGGAGDLDHFIAWSRYPVDLGHNFVFSHPACNLAKREHLAHPEHLRRWRESNLEGGDALAAAFDAARLPHDRERSRRITVWAYGQAELAGAHAWVEGRRVEALGSGWRSALGMEQVRMAAEEGAEYR